MNTSKKIIICLALVCVVCVVFLVSCRSVGGYVKTVRANWGIELPEYGAKEEFAYSTSSPHGDGVRYHIIDYPAGSESAKAQDSLFQLEKLFYNAPCPAESQIQSTELLLDSIDVEGSAVDWTRCRLIYLRQEDNSELYMYYQSDTGTVYILESFI
ncbi:MAG: hypothetical protein MJ194_05250 [Clostridia bacterium]|nr:hypothetical protein [Clostridia bacterium]